MGWIKWWWYRNFMHRHWKRQRERAIASAKAQLVTLDEYIKQEGRDE